MPVIDYYFSAVSPWAFLGHRALVELAARRHAAIRYLPVVLGEVFKNSGALPLGERPKARQEYRFLELQRWREKRRIPLNLRPKHFPTSAALADRTVAAIVDAGQDPSTYLESVFRACWVDDLDIADRDVLRERLADNGMDAEAILDAADSERVRDIYRRNTEQAVGLNVIGSPTYVLNGELFWGQDRLDLLEDALAAGRAPYGQPE